MDMNLFIDQVLSAATKAGITAAEVYYASGDSFSAMCVQGEIANYSVSSSGGLSLRGLYHDKMGYSSTEAFDDAAIAQLVNGVIESAELIEDEAPQEIFKGSEHYETLVVPAPDATDESKKLSFLLALEDKALHQNPKVTQVSDCMLSTETGVRVIKNTFGLSLSHAESAVISYVAVTGRENEKVASEVSVRFVHGFDELNVDEMAKEAVDKTVFMLDAQPVTSGTYRAIFTPEAMMDMLSTFSGVFSADNAQEGMSLLAGREGESVAAACVTLCDDPLLKGGFASCPFDAEGVATRRKNVIENGVLKTLLHNLKTARKAGVETTGNASKGGYSAPVRVAPTNFYFVPGEKSKEQLMNEMGNGLVILDVSGLHAGANPISGDFSLIAKGYTVVNGQKAAAVNQITVAGNFYQLLKNIRAVGSDLTFLGGIGSPSVDVGEISVAGK